MQDRLGRQQRRGRHCAGRCEPPVAENGFTAQGEDQQGRHHIGHGILAVVLQLAQLEQDEGHSEGDRQGREGPPADRTSELARDSAQQAAERVGPDAGGATALGDVARAPAALHAHQEADRQRQAQSLEGLHGRGPPGGRNWSRPRL